MEGYGGSNSDRLTMSECDAAAISFLASAGKNRLDKLDGLLRAVDKFMSDQTTEDDHAGCDAAKGGAE